MKRGCDVAFYYPLDFLPDVSSIHLKMGENARVGNERGAGPFKI